MVGFLLNGFPSREGGGVQVQLRLPFCLALFVVLALTSASGFPQTAKDNRNPPSPDFKLRVILTRDTYAAADPVFIKVELTNVSGKNLCFHEPGLEAETPGFGYLETEVTGPYAGEREFFIDHEDVRTPSPREKLVLAIKENWIKLKPEEVYVTKQARVYIGKNPGHWRLVTSYYPPEAEFGGQAEFHNYLDSAAREVGCTVPWTKVSADPVVIAVVSPPKR